MRQQDMQRFAFVDPPDSRLVTDGLLGLTDNKVAILLIIMVILLLLQLTNVQVFQANSLRQDPRNSRMLLDEYSRQRGLITTADGTVIALSVPIESRLKFLRQYPREGAEAFAPESAALAVTSSVKLFSDIAVPLL